MDASRQAKMVADLEGSFCNPRKLKEAQEIREDLRAEGYSDAEIDRMAEETAGAAG